MRSEGEPRGVDEDASCEEVAVTADMVRKGVKAGMWRRVSDT